MWSPALPVSVTALLLQLAHCSKEEVGRDRLLKCGHDAKAAWKWEGQGGVFSQLGQWGSMRPHCLMQAPRTPGGVHLEAPKTEASQQDARLLQAQLLLIPPPVPGVIIGHSGDDAALQQPDATVTWAVQRVLPMLQ